MKLSNSCLIAVWRSNQTPMKALNLNLFIIEHLTAKVAVRDKYICNEIVLNSLEKTFSPRGESLRKEVFSELFSTIDISKFPLCEFFVYLIHSSIPQYELQKHANYTV